MLFLWRFASRGLTFCDTLLIYEAMAPIIILRIVLALNSQGKVMNISSSSQAHQMPSMSILKSANQQPELAGELISKTIAGLLSTQSVQIAPQTASPSPTQSGIGTMINTVA